MKFSELATYFEKLESTSSRIELTNILSDLLKHVSADEIEKVYDKNNPQTKEVCKIFRKFSE